MDILGLVIIERSLFYHLKQFKRNYLHFSYISILTKNKKILICSDFPHFGRHIQIHKYVSQAQIQIVEACLYPSLKPYIFISHKICLLNKDTAVEFEWHEFSFFKHSVLPMAEIDLEQSLNMAHTGQYAKMWKKVGAHSAQKGLRL